MNPIVTALMIPFLGTALALSLATSILGIMPYMLAFAAGAMLDVVL